MRNQSFFILLFLCLLLLPFQTHAEEKVSVKAIGGKNKVTIKVDSSLKNINCVEGTIRGGRKQFKRFNFEVKNGKGSVTCDGLLFDTEYTLDVLPYHSSRYSGNSNDDYFYNKYEKIITVKTLPTNKYKIYRTEKAAGNALYKAYEKGKDTRILLKKSTPNASLKKVRKYVYTDKKAKMHSLIEQEYFPNISMGMIRNEKIGNDYYTIFETRMHDQRDKNKKDIQRMQKCIKRSDAIIKKLKPKLKGKSKRKKAFILYNYLCKNCRYVDGKRGWTAYNALIKKRAVCEGYANAYAMLCNRAGINAVVLHGRNHAYVGCELGGKVYVCDPTWDDKGRRAGTSYFMKGRHSRFFKEKGHELSMARAYLKKIDGISHHFAY